MLYYLFEQLQLVNRPRLRVEYTLVQIRTRLYITRNHIVQSILHVVIKCVTIYVMAICFEHQIICLVSRGLFSTK